MIKVNLELTKAEFLKLLSRTNTVNKNRVTVEGKSYEPKELLFATISAHNQINSDLYDCTVYYCDQTIKLANIASVTDLYTAIEDFPEDSLWKH